MTLQEFIRQPLNQRPSTAALEEMAAALKLSIPEFFDKVALAVAEGYWKGEHSWEVGDAVMNNLYTAAYHDADIGLPDFALKVFEAFDEGEYIHRDGNEDGEPRTRALLASLIGEGRA